LANILYNMKRVLWLTVQTAGPDQKNPIAHQPSGADAPGSVPLVAEKPCQRPPYRQFLEVSNCIRASPGTRGLTGKWISRFTDADPGKLHLMPNRPTSHRLHSTAPNRWLLCTVSAELLPDGGLRPQAGQPD
jgi:hypothetical protein